MAVIRNIMDIFFAGVIILRDFTSGSILEIAVLSPSTDWTQLITSSKSNYSGTIHWIKHGNTSLFDTVSQISSMGDNTGILITPNPRKRPPIDAIKTEGRYRELCNLLPHMHRMPRIHDVFDQPEQTNHLHFTGHVIKELSWSSVIILIDSDNGDEAQLLTRDLSNNDVKSNTFFMEDDKDNLNFLLHMIKVSGSVRVQPFLRFVVMGTFSRVTRVFKEAELFDIRFGKQSLLRHFSQWLVLLPQGSLMPIEAMDLNLDHVAVIIKPSDTIDSSELTQSLTRIAVETLSEEHIFNKSQAADIFLKLLESQTVHVRVTVHTLLWKTDGRRFANVKLTELEHYCSQIFPNVQLGLNQRQLRGAVLPWSPFIARHEENGTIYYTHASVDMLDFLAEVLNFTYILLEPDDEEWGRPNPTDPTKFTGLLGMLQNGGADLVPCPMGISHERETVADFLSPIYHAYNGITLRKSQTSVAISSALTDPFRWEVYAYGGLTLISVTVLHVILERINPFYLNEHSKKKRLTPAGIVDSVMFFVGAAIHQGSVHLPQSWTGRTLVSFWWLYCIIMTAAYSGNLIASLTVNEEKMPFSTIQELIDNDNVKLGVWKGVVIQTELESSNDTQLRKLWGKILDSAAKDPSVLSVNPSEHFNKVITDNYGYLSDMSELKTFEATVCDVYILEEVFLPKGYSMAFPEGSPLTDIFSREILRIRENGLLQFWMRSWSPVKDHSSCPSPKDGAQPIELEKLAAVALAVLAGILCSGVSLLIEVALKSSAALLPK